jgi:hypothetical protein
MKAALAEYILKLNDASQKTRRAEDRPLYEKYLAEAGVILSMVELNMDVELIRKEIQAHERLWGIAWLIDDVKEDPSEAWQKAKKVFATQNQAEQ